MQRRVLGAPCKLRPQHSLKAGHPNLEDGLIIQRGYQGDEGLCRKIDLSSRSPLLPQHLLELQIDRLAERQQALTVVARQQLNELILGIGQMTSSACSERPRYVACAQCSQCVAAAHESPSANAHCARHVQPVELRHQARISGAPVLFCAHEVFDNRFSTEFGSLIGLRRIFEGWRIYHGGGYDPRPTRHGRALGSIG
jgi:hypothetical protein